jgi:hypothetical protein
MFHARVCILAGKIILDAAALTSAFWLAFVLRFEGDIPTCAKLKEIVPEFDYREPAVESGVKTAHHLPGGVVLNNDPS